MQLTTCSRRHFWLATCIVTISLVAPWQLNAAIQTFSLDAQADLTSYFTSDFSGGITRLDLTATSTGNHSFFLLETPDEDSPIGNDLFDFFPNDEAMKFGYFEYDDSGLVAGNGTTPITGLTLGIESDPTDSSYVNGTWLSFTTLLDDYSGDVTLNAGMVTGIELQAEFTLSDGTFGPLQLTAPGGIFSIVGDRFRVLAQGTFDQGTPAPYADYDPAVSWDWAGNILGVDIGPICNPDTGGDVDGNGTVEFADFLILSSNFGAAVDTHEKGDLDCNGSVEFADFLILSSNFGSASASQPVPEPSWGAMLLPGGVLGIHWLRRRRR